jgi:curved DNA-binding protein CbpA
MRGIDELDHYELLEVKRHATIGEVDRAYRIAEQTYAEGSLALYSVFENRDAAAIRERLDEAFRVLSDPDLRGAYDQENPEAAPQFASPSASPGSPASFGNRGEEQVVMFGDPLPIDAAWAPEGLTSDHPLQPLSGFDPIEQLGAQDEAVEEFDALEDDGRGEFDGVRLRRNRLFRGYEIDDIASVTKVSTSHLRNIEDENFGDLPADVYVRGFVTAYAQTIGLDPKVVVPSYMARVQGFRDDEPRGGFLARR